MQVRIKTLTAILLSSGWLPHKGKIAENTLLVEHGAPEERCVTSSDLQNMNKIQNMKSPKGLAL